MPGIWDDQYGTTFPTFNLGISGVTLKDSSGNLLVRNPGDTADAQITVSQLSNSTNNLLLGTSAGANLLTLSRNSAQITPLTLIFPLADGTAGQALTKKSGSPANTIELEWSSTGSTAQLTANDVTAIAFGSAATVAMFTLPANAILDEIKIIVDTSFNGTASGSVGIAGQTSKYFPSNRFNLLSPAGTAWRYHPNLAPVGTPENIIFTYSAGGATSGAARILVSYSNPT